MNIRSINKILLVASVSALSIGLIGCGKNGLHGTTGTPLMNGGHGSSGSGTQVNGVAGANGFNGQSFGGDSSGSVSSASVSSASKVVYFGFDKYSLNDKAEAVVSRNTAILLKDPSLHVMVAGHTDPRGSESYNFHLGQRRADAVQSYFLQHGVAASQVCTISYGELRPAATPAQFGGNKLKAYALDRRAVIEYNKTCEGQKDS
jgi:peptidoglycan-associated lipoprotein